MTKENLYKLHILYLKSEIFLYNTDRKKSHTTDCPVQMVSKFLFYTDMLVIENYLSSRTVDGNELCKDYNL